MIHLQNLEELLSSDFQEKLITFGSLLPDIFSVMDISSHFVFMNKIALDAVCLELDDVLGSSYACFKTNIVELAETFLDSDKQLLARKKPTVSASWQKIGGKDEWSFLIGKKQPIYDANSNIIGISSYFSDMTSMVFPNIQKFFSAKKLPYFYGLRKPFEFSICGCDEKFNLSRRETEILFYILYGRTSKEIAENLGLSCRTIESHIENIKNKMDVNTKYQLVDKSINAGYLGTFPLVLFEKICGIKVST